MITTVRDITDAIRTQVQAQLGVDYRELPYVNDVQKNSFRTSTQRWGVRPLASNETTTVTKYITFTQTFEIVLSKGYLESTISDSNARNAALDLYEMALDLHRHLINTKAGLPAKVLNILNLSMAEAEYLDEDKVAIVRLTLDVLYRENLL